MLCQTRDEFSKVLDVEQQGNAVELCEISMNNLLREGVGDDAGEVDHLAFLDRADALQGTRKDSPLFPVVLSFTALPVT